MLLQSIKEKQTLQKPITNYSILQTILADSAFLIEAARGLVYRAAILNDEGKSNTKLASMAKCFASDAAMKVTYEIIDALQIVDGYRSLKKMDAVRMYRDSKLTQIFEGTNQIQRLVIARQLLKDLMNT